MKTLFKYINAVLIQYDNNAKPIDKLCIFLASACLGYFIAHGIFSLYINYIA
jgi:hypothetical protein